MLFLNLILNFIFFFNLNFQLQQYRQKKDSRVGKSSKKSSKTQQYDYDADSATSALALTTSSQVTDEKVDTKIDSNLDITESSEPQSFEESWIPDFNASSVNLLSDAITYDMVAKSKPASNSELAVQVQGIGHHDSELPVRNEGENAYNDDAEVAKEVCGISSSLGSECGSTSDGMSVPVDLPLPASVNVAAGKAISVDREAEEREDTLLASKDIPLTSLMQTQEDQVTDVGCALSLHLSLCLVNAFILKL